MKVLELQYAGASLIRLHSRYFCIILWMDPGGSTFVNCFCKNMILCTWLTIHGALNRKPTGWKLFNMKYLVSFLRLEVLTDACLCYRLVEEADYKSTKELFSSKGDDKTIDNFIPKSESDFLEYAELISHKLRPFEVCYFFLPFNLRLDYFSNIVDIWLTFILFNFIAEKFPLYWSTQGSNETVND